MSTAPRAERLSHIATQWTLIFEAHRGSADEVARAQNALMERYCGAVYRYLLGSVRDHHAAEELCQEFAVRFLRGDFHRADPERGRFRDYVKRALHNLLADYCKRQNRDPATLPSEGTFDARADPGSTDKEPAFVAAWRAELLERTWEALQVFERASGARYHDILRWRAENPEAPSIDWNKRFAAETGRALSDAAMRQMLHRAREKFADLLLEEVGRSLSTWEKSRLEQELADLELLGYCAAALGAGRNPPRFAERSKEPHGIK